MTENEPFLASGAKLDHYKVLRFLGRGGNGEVYLARDEKLGRRVALKIVLPHALESPDVVERFLLEARTTATFSPPHIVTIPAAGHCGCLVRRDVGRILVSAALVR